MAVLMGAATFSSQVAFADGKYFPEKAYQVAPAIPTQRAILVYRDGVEKLTIESALDGPGQEFGWVIPLPSRPTEFQAASPGLIKTLGWAIQPYITHDLRGELTFYGTLAAFVTLICLVLTLPASSPIRILLLVAVVFTFVSALMPSLQRAANFGGSITDVSGVRVREVQEIGSYQLAVLDANDSGALALWLESNGFAGLNEADEAIVSDYIREKWCFVAARLRREQDGYSRPHPLSMSFASRAPIYPMRLTATAGNDVYLELFVIADKRAACDKLTLELADTYDQPERTPSNLSQESEEPGFVGRTYRQNVGHPAAVEHFWNGCILSKLCGVLKPQDMAQDIALQLRTHEPCRVHYFSRQGARGKAWTYGLSSWCILLAPLTLVFGRKTNLPGRRRVFCKHIISPALLLSLLIGTVTYAVLPKVDTRSVGIKGSPPRIYDAMQRKQMIFEAETIADEHGHFAGMNRDAAARLFEEYYASRGATNAFTSEPIKHEDSPGNYTVFQDDRGIVWRTYSLNGYPQDWVLTSSGK